MQQELQLDQQTLAHIGAHIADCEKEMDDDAESIITNQRYAYINKVVTAAVHKQNRAGNMTVSDKIDRVVTNRIAGAAHLCLRDGADLCHRHGRFPDLDRHHGHRLDQRCAVRGDRTPGRAGLYGKRRLRAVADRSCRGRHCGRCRRGAGLCAADARLFLLLSILEDIGYMPVSPLLWTASSANSAFPARASSRCWSAPAAACRRHGFPHHRKRP